MDGTNRTLPYAQRDIADALPEYFLARGGLASVQDPCAAELIERGVSLPDIAAHFVGSTRGEPAAAIINRALGSADFGHSMVTAFAKVVTTQFDVASSGVRRMVRQIKVRDYRPFRAPSLAIGDFAAVPEFAEFAPMQVQADAPIEATGLTPKGMSVLLTREALVNDDAGFLVALAEQIANAAALNIQAAIAAALENTDTLDDGAALFSEASTINNLVAAGGSAPSITSLDAAFAKVYRAPRPLGGIAAVTPRFIVVPPELAVTTAVLLSTFDSPNVIPEAVVMPFTSTQGWYLLPDPERAPVLGMLQLEGARSPLLIEQRRVPISRDGIGVRSMLDFRIVRLARAGAFKNDGA